MNDIIRLLINTISITNINKHLKFKILNILDNALH